MLTAGLVINVCPEEYKLRAAQRGRAGRSTPTGQDGTDRGAGSISAAIVLHKQVETTSCNFIFVFRGYLFTAWQCLSRTARMGNEGGEKKKKIRPPLSISGVFAGPGNSSKILLATFSYIKAFPCFVVHGLTPVISRLNLHLFKVKPFFPKQPEKKKGSFPF